jgi:hypothetical protein
MFYFGFLSSYLPYILLIVAPLCYYLYGTATLIDEVDKVNEIHVEASKKDYNATKIIHFEDVAKTSDFYLITNATQFVYNKKSKLKYDSPPPLMDLTESSDHWSRPPPQIIM